jgi:hypothetical protein
MIHLVGSQSLECQFKAGVMWTCGTDAGCGPLRKSFLVISGLHIDARGLAHGKA